MNRLAESGNFTPEVFDISGNAPTAFTEVPGVQPEVLPDSEVAKVFAELTADFDELATGEQATVFAELAHQNVGRKRHYANDNDERFP